MINIQVQVPWLKEIALATQRLAQAIEDIRKQGMDDATAAAIESATSDLKTSADELAASVAANQAPQPKGE